MSARHDISGREALFTLSGVNKGWRELLGRARVISVPRHAELNFLATNEFFLLVRGSIRLSCLAESGQERVVMLIGADTLFGEIAHLHMSAAHQYSLRALEKCEIACFPQALLEDVEFYREYPHLVQSLVHSIGLKAGAFFAQLFDSGLLEVEGRVCRSLFQLWKEHAERQVFCPGISQGDFATMLGIHRSSLCRVLHSLRDRKIIGKFSKKTLEILDSQLLAKLAHSVMTA